MRLTLADKWIYKTRKGEYITNTYTFYTTLIGELTRFTPRLSVRARGKRRLTEIGRMANTSWACIESLIELSFEKVARRLDYRGLTILALNTLTRM